MIHPYEIDNTKVVTINCMYNQTSTTSVNIFLEFLPDVMILKSISGQLTNSTNTPQLGTIIISSDLCTNSTNNVLCSFAMLPVSTGTDAVPYYTNYFNSMFNISYKTPNFSNKNYSFNLSSSQVLDFSATIFCEFNIVLEFIKYIKPFKVPELSAVVPELEHRINPRFK